MSRVRITCPLFTVAVVCWAAQLAPGQDRTANASASSTEARVLFVTQSAGFTHPVVRRARRARLSHAERCFVEAAKGQFAVDCEQDASVLSAALLARYKAVVFYTTGELPLDDKQKAALIDFVRKGGGFAGTHSATDTFYRWPAYNELIGGYFDGHPWHQKVRVLVEDRSHPATAALGGSFEIADEIYQFKAWSRSKVHVLMSLDPGSVEIGRGKRKDQDYALAWCRDFGKGRVFYTALGHRPEVWRDRRFLKHFVAGVRWAMNAEASIAEAPAGAERLFDGNSFDAWRPSKRNAKQVGWKIDKGTMVVVPGTGSIETRKAYGDFRLHLEFMIPKGAKQQGNSGVYLQRRYEVQILDGFGKRLAPGDCGGIYRRKAADANVCRRPGEWQSYDIWFRQPRWKDSQKTANARITVIHNGVTIHDDVEIPGKTGAGKQEAPGGAPLLLQDHGARVRFRNVWIDEL